MADSGEQYEERGPNNGFAQPAQFARTGGGSGRHTVGIGGTGQANAQAPAGGGRGPRVRDSFDFGWKFFKGDAPGAQQPDFADASWKDVDLPHDFSIEGPFSENAPAKGQGGFLPTGVGWYRKHFSIPESYRDRKVAIEFDGVYQLSEVWINGLCLAIVQSTAKAGRIQLTATSPGLKPGSVAITTSGAPRPA